jgi:hypothetical protein
VPRDDDGDGGGGGESCEILGQSCHVCRAGTRVMMVVFFGLLFVIVWMLHHSRARRQFVDEYGILREHYYALAGLLPMTIVQVGRWESHQTHGGVG